MCFNNNIIYEKFTNNKLKLKIIVTTYNPGSQILNKCLKSIENQNYINYDVFIIEDASTKDIENTHTIIKQYTNKYSNWNYHINTINKGPLESRIIAIDKSNCNNEDIIISIDGDDTLSHNTVFNIINNIYNNNNIWITFGNYIINNNSKYSNSNIICNNYNWKQIIYDNKFRNINSFIFSHLKTFKYKLYKNINHNDLKQNNQYLQSATDVALMIPMLEMAGNRFKCINSILYNYTLDHSESIHNKNRTGQRKNELYIKSLSKYHPL